jgi:Leucine Rich repeats (2 copies)
LETVSGKKKGRGAVREEDSLLERVTAAAEERQDAELTALHKGLRRGLPWSCDHGTHGFLKRLPPELERLSSLQTLDLSWCGQLSDLSPLAGLSSLQTLNLFGCGQLSGDLSPLAGLSSLQTLNLSECTGVGKFAPLQALVSILQSIHLFGCRFDDLPTEVCVGKMLATTSFLDVQKHSADLQSGHFLNL